MDTNNGKSSRNSHPSCRQNNFRLTTLKNFSQNIFVYFKNCNILCKLFKFYLTNFCQTFQFYSMKKKILIAVLPILLFSFIEPHHPPIKTRQFMDIISDANDGPYVFYGNEKVYIKYITTENGIKNLTEDSMLLADKMKIPLTVNTDIPGKTFQVHLKDKLVNEKCEYKKAARQMVLSDIEGNFDAFRKLLLAGNVMNENFDWTFGEGNLVLVGDFFDRGTQVTEVLWLIYALEEKAKQAGGYIHFILGNHEIMNMSADLRYLNAKYAENAVFMKQDYNNLYSINTELGRWLRTKNVVERIGDFLYLHGGISRNVNNLEISLQEINNFARPFYADTIYKYPNLQTDIIYDNSGPFWYRGYYSGDKAVNLQILDSTLQKFHVSHIVTGHTPVSDTASVWFKGKLFNVDTPHAKGKSDALLIEGNKIYKINIAGEKVLLHE